jgi:hypothetical protein
MQNKRDIPALIARWLFRIGFVWAICLIPFTVLSGLGVIAESFSRWWVLCVFLLTGYSVWIGWRWRSRQMRALKFSVLFWLSSAVYNFLFLIPLVRDTGTFLVLFHPVSLWWSIATVASLMALLFEFRLPRHECQAA